MNHPLAALAPLHRRRLFAAVMIGTLLCGFALQRLDLALRSEAAPLGIISFELAGSTGAAAAILDSWDETARLKAAFGLGLDFLFLLLYSTAIAQACLWAGVPLRERGSPLAPLAPGVAWGQWGAAGLDALENGALWITLLHGAAGPWPVLAWWCAAPKFALVAAGLLYLAFGSVAIRLRPRD